MKHIQHARDKGHEPSSQVLSRHQAQRGFTLAEVLVTIVVYGLIMAAIAQVLVMIIQNSGQKLSALTSIDQVRFTGAKFSNEIRDAQSGVDGAFAIGQASTTQLIFYSAYGASTGVPRRIRYYLASSTLYRGVVVPAGSPLIYTLASEVVTPVIMNVVNSTTSVFNYYDGSYAGTSSPMSQPVLLTQVTFIKMNVQVLTQDVKNSTTTYAFSVGSAVRSLKTNLGN